MYKMRLYSVFWDCVATGPMEGFNIFELALESIFIILSLKGCIPMKE